MAAFWTAAHLLTGFMLLLGPSIPPAGAEGPDTTPPAPVAGLRAQDANDGKVNLTWDASADGDFAYYAVYTANDSFLSIGNRTATARLHNITAHNFTVTGLANGVQHYFAVTAVDGSGNENKTVVSVSATPTASPVADTTAPPAVTGVAAADAKDGRVNLSWVPVNVPDFGHYSIYVATQANAAAANLTAALRVDLMATGNATITGLEDNTTYYFAVTAVDISGNENRTVRATVSATPTPTAPAPTTRTPKPAQEDGTPYNIAMGLIIIVLVAAVTYMTLGRAYGSSEGETDGSGGSDREEEGPGGQDRPEEEGEGDGNEEE